MLKRLMLSAVVLGLAGCAAQRPMFIEIENGEDILRGSASGVYGSDMTFSATNANASLTCKGSFNRGSQKSVSGTLNCSDGQTGQYRLNTINAKGGPYWRGEGTLSSGQSFQIFINYLTNPDKR